MPQKFELITEPGEYLKRIRAVRTLGKVKAGDLGGLVEREDNLSHDGQCWIGYNAQCLGHAKIMDAAQLNGNAVAFGFCLISEFATVTDSAVVGGYADIKGRATVGGAARALGSCTVEGSVLLTGSCRVSEGAIIRERATIQGSSHVFGAAICYGDCTVDEGAHVEGDAKVYGRGRVAGVARLKTGEVKGNEVVTVTPEDAPKGVAR